MPLERKRELSRREREILVALVNGATPKRAAAMLGIHQNTVGTHLERAKRKLRARTSWQAVAIFAKGNDDSAG